MQVARDARESFIKECQRKGIMDAASSDKSAMLKSKVIELEAEMLVSSFIFVFFCG